MTISAISLLLLFIAMVVLNVLDYVSTSLVLSKGRGNEANPVMQFAMKYLGSYWWLSKLAIIMPFGAAVWFSGPTIPAIAGTALLDALFVWVVVNNYKIAWRLG